MSKLKELLNKNHKESMKGKAGGAAMCICGQNAGKPQECGEYEELIKELEKLRLEVDYLHLGLTHTSISNEF